MPVARIAPSRLGLERPADWVHHAACQGQDLTVFFPAGQGDRSALARRICATCPVSKHCLEDALAAGPDLAGIWAGTSQKQRRNILRHRAAIQPPPIEHGTRKGYRQHRENDEEPCAPCRAAEAKRVAADRAAKAAREKPSQPATATSTTAGKQRPGNRSNATRRPTP